MIKRFKELPKGVLRLLIVGYPVFMILNIWFFIKNRMSFGDWIEKLAGTIIVILGYWLIARVIIWVYDGFKKG